MSISKRHQYGVLLLAISIAALTIFLIIGFAHGTWQYDGGGSSNGAHWESFSGKLGISGYYLVPIFLVGAFGVVCLAWPSRKPPRLNSESKSPTGGPSATTPS